MSGPSALVWGFHTFGELGPEALYAVMVLRQRVFVVEQKCFYLDADGRDRLAKHLLGWSGPELVAYARVFAPGVRCPEASIGRVVTAPEVRGLGLGRETVRRALAGCAGAAVHISAQFHLREFYESLGFSVTGPAYDEDGIPHLPMRHPGGAA